MSDDPLIATYQGGGQIFTQRSKRIISAAKLAKASVRKVEGLLLLEGLNSIKCAQSKGLVHEVFITETAARRYSDFVKEISAVGINVFLITPSAATKLSDTVTTTGLFAISSVPSYSLEILKQSQLITVIVDGSDPGNVGTIIRLSDALGADVVVITGNGVDPYNPKVVRSSAGSIFHLPVVVIDQLSDTVALLKTHGLRICATSPYGLLSLPNISQELSNRVAWLFGSEAHGLPQEIIASADYTVSIPMYGTAESLNVSSAAAICLYATTVAQHS